MRAIGMSNLLQLIEGGIHLMKSVATKEATQDFRSIENIDFIVPPAVQMNP